MANLKIRRILGTMAEQGIDRENSDSKKGTGVQHRKRTVVQHRKRKDRSAAQEKEGQECSTGKGRTGVQHRKRKDRSAAQEKDRSAAQEKDWSAA